MTQELLLLETDRFLIVYDENALRLHGKYMEGLAVYVVVSRSARAPPDPAAFDRTLDLWRRTASVCREGGRPVSTITLPGGDEAKSWSHLETLVNWAFDSGATKRSVCIGFGGGALLNICGLFSGMMYRGIRVVYLPTTFLAMHDVVTSLKTSICHHGRKNNVGIFYAPLRCYIDTIFCTTLSTAEILSGMGELAKNACIFGKEHATGLCPILEQCQAEHREPTGDELLALIRLGVAAKMSQLEVDAHERIAGMVFEYGHTIGHALEKAYGDGTVPHGVGVAFGMMACSYVSEKLGHMSADDRAVHDRICRLVTDRWPLPEPRPALSSVMSIMMRDSKRGIAKEQPHEISDVLLRSVGDTIYTSTQNLSKFPADLVRQFLAEHLGFA